jgi:hypothetical protein
LSLLPYTYEFAEIFAVIDLANSNQGEWKMKKFIKGVVLATTIAFTVGVTEVSAMDSYPRTSGWDYVGSSTWEPINKVTSSYSGGSFESTGGSIKIVIPAHYAEYGGGNHMRVQLWEDDGLIGDDFVKEWNITSGNGYSDTLTYTLDGDLDGDNKRAEFYLKYTTDYNAIPGTITVKFYD